MADQLSRVFQALADPTRRDMVARLAADGDATVGELAAPYDVTVQAVSKHLKVLEEAGLVSRSRDAQRRPVPPRGGGVRPDDEVDRALPARGRGAVPPPRRRARPDGRRGATRTPDPTTRRRKQHHDHHDQNRDQHRGRPRPADHPHHPRVRRARRSGCSGPGPTPSCSAVGRPAEHRDRHRRVGLPHRRGLALQPPATTDVESTGSAGPSTRSGRDERIVQTFTFEGHARRRQPRDADLRGRSRAAAAGYVGVVGRRLRWRRDQILASGMEVGVIEGYEKLDELLERASHERPPRSTAGWRAGFTEPGRRGVRLGRTRAGRRLDRARRGRPPGGVVPRVPRPGAGSGSARRSVGRRRPGRGVAGARATRCRRCSTTRRRRAEC